ncbi:hypothetical protein FX984_06373 [Pseudomonas marginalis]|nr:hypothetical protein FX984_06373 [Pseudomonas marginalis]
MDAALPRSRRAIGIPGLQQRVLFFSRQQWQARNRMGRCLHHRPQQAKPMLGHASNGGRLEQICRVGQRCPEPVRGRLGIQAQVKVCSVTIPFQTFDLQTRNRLRARLVARIGLVVEHHLEQRAMAQAAFRLQRLHQLLERQVLMRLRVQGRVLDLLQQFDKRQLTGDIGLQHLGIDEETNQTLGLDPVAVGNRHADANIRLAAVAIQQGLEGRQQHHEQGRALTLGQSLQFARQRGVQHQVQACAAMALYRRAWMIQRQLQHGLLTGQAFSPVGQLAGLLARLHPSTLPHRIIGILNQQCRQLRLQALAERSISLHQLIDHYLHRPGVGDDVVLHQHQHMIVRGQAQQLDPQQRAFAQVERTSDFCFDPDLQAARLITVQNLVFDQQRGRRIDPLYRALAIHDKHGTQGFMPFKQAIEATLQGPAIQGAAQAQGRRDVIRGALRLQLPEEPLPLLGIGQRQGLITCQQQDRRRVQHGA